MRRFASVLLAAALTTSHVIAEDSLVAHQRDWGVMATTLDIAVYRPASEAALASVDLDAAYAEILAIDRAMSLYRADSELVAINSKDQGHPVSLSEPMFEVLSAAADFGAISGGDFDISIQPLVNAWGFYHVKRARIPESKLIDEARQRVGRITWSLNANDRTVTLKPGTRFDLGGIAKGYAIDRAIALLRARQVPAALVNLGGNIAVLGQAPGGRPWVVGIEHPRKPKLMGQIKLWSGAVATSGDYDRYFEMQGQRYNHIIDPRTGWPVKGIYSLTVVAPNATTADALSTAAFVLGPKRGLDLIRQQESAGAVVVEPQTSELGEALVVTRTHDVKISNQFEITIYPDPKIQNQTMNAE